MILVQKSQSAHWEQLKYKVDNSWVINVKPALHIWGWRIPFKVKATSSFWWALFSVWIVSIELTQETSLALGKITHPKTTADLF